LRGSFPDARKPATKTVIHDRLVSRRLASTTVPAPVPARFSSAASMPIAAHMPVPMSTSDTLTRTGSSPSLPVTLMMPEKACINGS